MSFWTTCRTKGVFRINSRHSVSSAVQPPLEIAIDIETPLLEKVSLPSGMYSKTAGLAQTQLFCPHPRDASFHEKAELAYKRARALSKFFGSFYFRPLFL